MTFISLLKIIESVIFSLFLLSCHTCTLLLHLFLNSHVNISCKCRLNEMRVLCDLLDLFILLNIIFIRLLSYYSFIGVYHQPLKFGADGKLAKKYPKNNIHISIKNHIIYYFFTLLFSCFFFVGFDHQPFRIRGRW
jgi:hypothetical protein